MSTGKGLAKDFLDMALTVLIAGLVLSWAWHNLLRPLLPLLVFGVVVLSCFRWQRR